MQKMIDRALLYERDELIKSLLTVEDINIIKKIRAFLSQEEELPATMTIEQLREEVMFSVNEAKQGKGISHDDLLKEIDQW
ncbi:hypothetical protein HX017_05215 [Myroides marinus]|uniref:hypothetical protein n=1 Tax=Myroides marinus TaxID=703342 RepID=UPI0025763CC9|nr:hypothetical protein [Myroides marinus]MDM1364350.1 hypothetical protein [Myroides marinus]